jgi:uncharacterized protein YuzE
MKIKYFQDTDTLYIEFKPAEVAETRDLDENILLDLDQKEISAASPSNTQKTVPTFLTSLTKRSYLTTFLIATSEKLKNAAGNNLSRIPDARNIFLFLIPSNPLTVGLSILNQSPDVDGLSNKTE